MNLSHYRREYMSKELVDAEMAQHPMQQFTNWFSEAGELNIQDVSAMSLATASKNAAPSLRIVLLKFFDENGFVFYTNFHSQKARQIAENSQVALSFHWRELERQVLITGIATKVSLIQSARYFASRPRGSQLGAWISEQSSVIPSRKVLEAKMKKATKMLADAEVPCPPHWGGYCVQPESIEFWQGLKDRLNDRIQYRKMIDGNWQRYRLSP